MTEHAKMRGLSDTDLSHPKLLLRQPMLKLLIDIISKNSEKNFEKFEK